MIHKFLHFSDTHQDTNGESSILSMLSTIQSDESVIPLCTGDMALYKLQDGHNTTICSKCLYVIGNHDRTTNSADSNLVAASSRIVNQTYFSNTYVTRNASMANVPNPTYWSFQKDGIRIIGLDCTLTDATEISNEKTWLSNQFSDARSKNQKVIAMSHIIARGKQHKRSTFTNVYYLEQLGFYAYGGDVATSYFATCINPLDSIIRANKDVVAFCIYGHEHSDLYFDSNGYPEIVLGDTWTGDILAYNNVARATNANAKDIFVMNEYIYDSVSNYLEIYRIGADRCVDGTRRKMMCIDLSANAIVSDWSSV